MMKFNFRNKLALNLIFQIIIVVAVISAGFTVLSTMQTKEMQKRIFDKAELYSFILGANLDKIIADNLMAYNQLQKATIKTVQSQDRVEELRVITKEHVIVASSMKSNLWEPIEEIYRSIADEVIRTGQAKSIPRPGMGKEIVVHFLPIIVSIDGQEQFIGLIQLNVHFPSQQDQVISSARANTRIYFLKEAHQIAQSLGEDLKDVFLEAERNFGYLQRLTDNMRADQDIEDIKIFTKDLGVLISGEGPQSTQFIVRERTPLQLRAMAPETTLVMESVGGELRVASPLYVHKGREKMVAGAVELSFSLDRIQALIDEKRNDVLMMNLAIACIFSLLIGLFFKRRIFTPVKELTLLTERIKKDDFSERSRVFSDDELGRLAKNFNSMMDELDKSKKEIKNWNLRLQEKVEHVTKELEKKQKQLLKTEKLASVGVLSGGIAHEINNPIGIILGQTQMLLRELKDKKKLEDKEEVQKLLKSIEQHALRCSHIVKSLLQFTKTKTFQFSRTDAHSCIESALNFTQDRFEQKNIQVTKDFASDISIVNADAIQLDQVFINILNNAEQSMNSDGEIHIATYLAGGKEGKPAQICISFKDNGAGIGKEDIAKIFDPFFSTKAPGEGVGLGLSVSYGIIKAHNGTIEIKSESGHGAEIIVKLPLIKKG